MNITPLNNQLPLQTAVNIQTDSLRRDNHQREVISKPEAPHHSVAEKGVASDKDKARTPAQQNESIDFSNIRKQAELLNNTINGNEQENNDSSHHPFDRKNDETENSHDHDEITNADEHHNDAEERAEQLEIRALERRDKEVRAHELAHSAAGGGLTGSPSYTFEIGPDGKKYAVSGEVSVDVTPVKGDPSATIAKMKKVQAAALAPVNPSPQDIRVAATASQHIREAQAELNEQSQENSEQNTNISTSSIEINNETFSERTLAVEQRSHRIEQFYLKINQAYTKSINHNFELIA